MSPTDKPNQILERILNSGDIKIEDLNETHTMNNEQVAYFHYELHKLNPALALKLISMDAVYCGMLKKCVHIA